MTDMQVWLQNKYPRKRQVKLQLSDAPADAAAFAHAEGNRGERMVSLGTAQPAPRVEGVRVSEVFRVTGRGVVAESDQSLWRIDHTHVCKHQLH